MSRTPFDSFAKQFLERFLTPLGDVDTTYEVPGESRFVDVLFLPGVRSDAASSTLGLLGRIAATACLIEPFRNQPSLLEVRNCLLKLFLVQAETARRARREDERLLEAELPQLWVLAPSASANLLTSFGAKLLADWMSGVYALPVALKSFVIAINQLPQTEETLWVRLLGRGITQQQAIEEVLALSIDDLRRSHVLQLLVNWKISLELTGAFEQEEQNLMAQLSQAYLEWEQTTRQQGIQQGIQQGERTLILRMLARRFGDLSETIRQRINALKLNQLESLGEALLDFSSLSDLEAWLTEQSQSAEQR